MASAGYRHIALSRWTAAAAALSLALLGIEAASFRWYVELGRGPSWWSLREGRFIMGWFYPADTAKIRSKVQGWGAGVNSGVFAGPWQVFASMQIPRCRITGGPFAFVNVPLWPFVPATAAGAFLVHRRSRPPLPGRCPRCGYDLAGNTTGICPECGAKAGAR